MPTSRHRRPLTSLLLVFFLSVSVSGGRLPADAAAELLTYRELVDLYELSDPPAPLQIKLQKLLTTPFVNNQMVEKRAHGVGSNATLLGRSLRIAHWNIERGLEYEVLESIFTDSDKYVSLLDQTKYPAGSEKRAMVLEQAEALRQADVIVLNEVDWGLKRTGYRNVVADLAAAAKLNYAFGTEFIEVDPIALGKEKFEKLEASERGVLNAQIKIDTELYKGLHGSAILSRYPLENVRLIPFQFQGYDWYEGEKKGTTKIEQGYRKASEIAFREKVEREVRRGGRTMLLADIVDSSFPAGRVTIVATHLESKTKPSNRVRQLEELLTTIKDIKNPVVVAGDMNTSTRDSTPTSIKREIKKRLGSKKYWIEQSIKFLTGLSWPSALLLGGANEYRKQADPTVRNVHFVATNPEARFFELLKNFRFADGGAFDFRGSRERSIGSGASPLANSNQRGRKGFITTFEVERTIGFVGKFKLDWIFVKPARLSSPYDDRQSYLFAPHFARTLKELNHSIEDRVSDHDPLIVDLPLGEPDIRPVKDAAGAPGT